MRRRIVQGGGIQLSATILLTMAVLTLAGFHLAEATFIGFVLSLSSTAIVLKVYADRMEFDSGHGKISIGILLFQDMAVIPMMLLIPRSGNGRRRSSPPWRSHWPRRAWASR